MGGPNSLPFSPPLFVFVTMWSGGGNSENGVYSDTGWRIVKEAIDTFGKEVSYVIYQQCGRMVLANAELAQGDIGEELKWTGKNKTQAPGRFSWRL